MISGISSTIYSRFLYRDPGPVNIGAATPPSRFSLYQVPHALRASCRPQASSIVTPMCHWRVGDLWSRLSTFSLRHAGTRASDRGHLRGGFDGPDQFLARMSTNLYSLLCKMIELKRIIVTGVSVKCFVLSVRSRMRE